MSFSSFQDRIDEAGGEDGYIREMELSAPIECACIELKDMLASSGVDLDTYECAKAIMRRISRHADQLARIIRKSEGAGVNHQEAGDAG